MKIIIGSDHGGLTLKNKIVEHLNTNNYEVEDIGTKTYDSCDYPIYAKLLTDKVLHENCMGILICGTGIGMSIYANKVKGIRAALCSDTFSARLTRNHNNSNVLCIGERVVGLGLALDIVDEWLNAPYEGGRHQTRIDMIDLLDEKR